MGSAHTASADREANQHPLDPLTANEIRAVVAAIRSYAAMPEAAVGGKSIENLLFNSVTLKPPPKYSVLKWSGAIPTAELEEISQGNIQQITRQADVS
jgi:Cu2+-containing amine oxidase